MLFRRRRSEPEDTPIVPRVLANCGHLTLEKGEVSAFGDTVTTAMPRNAEGGFDYCLGCLAGMTITCAWCGEPIFIGDPVTLYGSVSGEGLLGDATPYSEDPKFFVGCLRWNCAQTGADRAGFWLPSNTGKGYVKRTRSLFEMALQSDVVVVNDLSDSTEEATILRFER
jgi:hypothetical protein